MTRFTALILCMSILINANSQSADNSKGAASITGKVQDSISGHALEYATVSLLANDKTLTGTTTNAAGQFILENIPVGSYRLLVEFIGYKAINLPGISITKKNE